MIKFSYFSFVKLKLSARKAFSSRNSTLDIVTFLTMKNQLQKKVEDLWEKKSAVVPTHIVQISTKIGYTRCSSLSYLLTSSLFHKISFSFSFNKMRAQLNPDERINKRYRLRPDRYFTPLFRDICRYRVRRNWFNPVKMGKSGKLRKTESELK